MKKILILAGALMMTFSVGAATGIKINAELRSQKVVYDNVTINQEIISYNGSTYVPLRKFGELTGTAIDYKNGVIYLGGGVEDTISKNGDIKYILDAEDASYTSTTTLKPDTEFAPIGNQENVIEYDVSECINHMQANNLSECNHKHD